MAHIEGHPQRDDRRALNRLFYQSYAGHAVQDVQKAAHAWFEQLRASVAETRLWIEPALALARQLRAAGHRLVAVSGASHEILAPLLDHLRFDHCLATRLEARNGVFTGSIVHPQMIGPGKAEAMRSFADEHGIDLQHSVACGDHITDLSMLECVGRALVVSGDRALESIARSRGWPVLQATVCSFDEPCAGGPHV